MAHAPMRETPERVRELKEINRAWLVGLTALFGIPIGLALVMKLSVYIYHLIK